MQNPKPITVYAANCRGTPTNCLYPHRIEVTDKSGAAKAFSRDIVCAEYRNNYRSVENFLTSNALPMDCDNDHSNDPALWITADDIENVFPDVTYFIHYSRHHMKPKVNSPPVPGFMSFSSSIPQAIRRTMSD